MMPAPPMGERPERHLDLASAAATPGQTDAFSLSRRNSRAHLRQRLRYPGEGEPASVASNCVWYARSRRQGEKARLWKAPAPLSPKEGGSRSSPTRMPTQNSMLRSFQAQPFSGCAARWASRAPLMMSCGHPLECHPSPLITRSLVLGANQEMGGR
jgi:hypothetical protein